jgi:hypothetical protein
MSKVKYEKASTRKAWGLMPAHRVENQYVEMQKRRI